MMSSSLVSVKEREFLLVNYHRLVERILQRHPVEFVSTTWARCVLCERGGGYMRYQCLSYEFVLHEHCQYVVTSCLDEMAAANARLPFSALDNLVQTIKPPSPQTHELASFNVQDGRPIIQDSDSEPSFTTAISHQQQLQTEESLINSSYRSILNSDYEAIRDRVDAWVAESSTDLNMGSSTSYSDAVSEIETETMSEITEAAEPDPRLRFATEFGGNDGARGVGSSAALTMQQIKDTMIQAAAEAIVQECARRFFDNF